MNEEVSSFIERINELFIEHDEVLRIWKKFDSLRLCNARSKDDTGKRMHKGDPRHLFLMGLSGVGKTQIGERYAERNPGYWLETEEEKIKIMPVIYVELPFPFTQLSFYTEILRALGTENIRRDARINHIKERVLMLLKKQRVEMIIFDEMNFIMRTKRFDDQEAMEMLKDLTNKCQLSIVCMGTPKIEPLRKMEDEYIRRFGIDTIKKFEECDDSFYKLVTDIENHIGPKHKIKMGDPATRLPQLLHRWSQGRIGYVHIILKEAYRLLGVFEEGFNELETTVLTVKVLHEAKINLFGKNDHLVQPKEETNVAR
ncbi:TniB family NTP-binding protein [Mycolicibacterium fortuitum]|nr:TniB family NTP-binding protein [Mycolicibacterium fortuitum]